MAWTRCWQRLGWNSRNELNWKEQKGKGEGRLEGMWQKGPGPKEEMAYLQTQLQVLRQSPWSWTPDPPLLSATLGENLCCLHSLVPRAYSIHPLSLVTASNQKPEVCREDLQNQPIWWTCFSAYTEKAISPSGLHTCWGDVGQSSYWLPLWEAAMHISSSTSLFMLIQSLKRTVIPPNCPSCWGLSPTNTRDMQKLQKLPLQETFLSSLVPWPHILYLSPVVNVCMQLSSKQAGNHIFLLRCMEFNTDLFPNNLPCLAWQTGQGGTRAGVRPWEEGKDKTMWSFSLITQYQIFQMDLTQCCCGPASLTAQSKAFLTPAQFLLGAPQRALSKQYGRKMTARCCFTSEGMGPCPCPCHIFLLWC